MIMPDVNANAEIVTINFTNEDELADIPAEMRETVAAEIAAFRERSNKRDQERLRREEEMEAQYSGRSRPRLGSPPVSAPSGPAGGANGIPLGPRVQGAPSGPKALNKDMQNGVTPASGFVKHWMTKEEEESDASDEELERRRKQRKAAADEKEYRELEAKLNKRESRRQQALERGKAAEQREAEARKRLTEEMAARLKDWDDEKEEQYKKAWRRDRSPFRHREEAEDERDRRAEAYEKERAERARAQAKGEADSFLDQQAEVLEARMQPKQQAGVKFTLGGMQRPQPAAPRRTAADIEGMLENEEEEDDTTKKRTLVPIQFDTAAEAASLTEEERKEAQQHLAKEIPSDKEGLFSWDIKWDYLDESIISERLVDYVEKRILEYLGVQDEALVNVAANAIRNKKKPEELISELEEVLDEDAESLVKKLWRMVIFYSEAEKRGISAA